MSQEIMDELDDAMRQFRIHIKNDIDRPFVRPMAPFVATKSFQVYGDTLEELQQNAQEKIKELLEDNVR